MIGGWLLAALVTCLGVDDTAAIQGAVDAGDVQLVGDCRLNGNTPINITPPRTVMLTGATVTMLPGCARSAPPCTFFQNRPGAVGKIRLIGGTLIGTYPTPAIPYEIAVRFDWLTPAPGERFSGQIDDTVFLNWRSDAVHVGGNFPSKGIRVTGVTVDGFGRNGMSFVNAEDIVVERPTCRNAKLGTSPGACVDIESNPPSDRIKNVSIYGLKASDVEVCVYSHKHLNATLMGENYSIYDSTCTRARKHCYIFSSVVGGNLINSTCAGAPIGVNIGAFTEAERSTNILLRSNNITANRAVVVAGAKNLWMIDDNLNNGLVETPALGVRGKFDVQPLVPTPPPPPVCQ